MILLLDAGNTRLKWLLKRDDIELASGMVVHQGLFDRAMPELVADIEKKAEVGAITVFALSSVLNESNTNALIESWKKFNICEVFVANVQNELAGVRCAYEKIETLGIDRWLALVAAYARYQSAVCVVDCGSAVTIDMVNNNGQHLGGYIVPGLMMSLKSLLGETDSVRPVSQNRKCSIDLGVNTEAAVLNGIVASIVGLIKLSASQLGIDCKNYVIVLTGGDADGISANLDILHKVVDALVIEGLELAESSVR